MIGLKFGTQIGDIKAHLGTKFSWNTISSQGGISDYSHKITPICCHAYRVNRLWEEAENQCMDKLTIKPQPFCSLKEIELKTTKIQQKNQQCVTTTRLRLANLIKSSETVKKGYGLQNSQGEKRCEIQGGSQEMAVMVG